ncbi:protein of unknown function DUF1345 [Rhodomicrobium vannielii ATCC 17100]|uniref:Transmembrane protein n=1 Tax=Rhodomicrobium vannielii (strain ATCC 17100 / DSM 162 / LMG 4299 / NCIMB 10020 / ATH 3.1.1) TaxID=648757 RepID=E3HZR6_RHOVT|nr:DUF1345 domain-containing protein [Rhodomicrobium vannielii]ADP72176.1 protein of unknown function DUF1345 [Rhodomicrobium vannielii ATCC 17100]
MTSSRARSRRRALKGGGAQADAAATSPETGGESLPQKANHAGLHHARRRGWYHPVSFWESLSIRPRFYSAVLVGSLAYGLLPDSLALAVRAAITWDLGGLTYLLLALRLDFTSDAAKIQKRAARRDDSRLIILTIILLAIAASFAAITAVGLEAKLPETSAKEKMSLAALALFTLVISWSVTQIAFALHYAHAFYRPDPGSDAGRGLEFPGCDRPDYWDFLYFATSIGAASQTSDTLVKSHALRRLVTLHAVVSFFFNTAVLALTVNISASLAG